MARPRLCLLTAGHLSTCPRLLKAADALHEAGYAVRVVSARFMDWATQADEALLARRAWRNASLDYRRETGNAVRVRSGLRQRAHDAALRLAGADALTAPRRARAYARLHDELVSAALAEPADLFYGATSGALAAAAEAGRSASVPYALDLEDYHPGENDASPEGRRRDALAARLVSDVGPGAAFVSTASAAMAAEYAREFRLACVTIDNVFPLPSEPPELRRPRGSVLRLYWFSQTVGPGRGLEELVEAIARAGVPAEVHLRGLAIPGYVETLGSGVVVHAPGPPETMVEACRAFDIGFAGERADTRSRELCLSNKALTYPLAGLAPLLSRTQGTATLAADLGDDALTFAPGDVEGLAALLTRAWDEPARLQAARKSAWSAAKARWHWEHPLEKGALLDAVARVVGP